MKGLCEDRGASRRVAERLADIHACACRHRSSAFDASALSTCVQMGLMKHVRRSRSSHEAATNTINSPSLTYVSGLFIHARLYFSVGCNFKHLFFNPCWYDVFD